MQEPLRQSFVALRIANESRALIHPSTSLLNFPHLWASFSARCFTIKFASQPRTPSTDTTRGVKEARWRAAASEYFFFFSSSAEVRMAVKPPLECDGASVRTSKNGTVWGCHTPLILRSVIREGTLSASFACLLHNWFFYDFLVNNWC